MDWADESLGYLINRAARILAHALGSRIDRHGVAIGQWAVLLFLYARDGQTQVELSRVVAIEPPTMVRTIDRMVRDGLVTRRPDPSDRRLSRIHLTSKAIGLRDQLFAEATAVNAAAAAVLSPDELERLKAYLRRVTVAVDAMPPDG
jgi:DNA-binding MarR family transcriptional regulator